MVSKVYKFKRSKRYGGTGSNSAVRIIRKGNANLAISIPVKDIPPLLPFETYKTFAYPKEFDRTLKTLIRQRDNYICQACQAKVTIHNSAVHHINYDKRDCSLLNLILLCRKCHFQSSSHRQYWYKYLYSKVTQRNEW